MATAQQRKDQQERSKQLSIAASSGDLATIRHLLDADTILLNTDTSILEACLHGQHQVVALMLDFGASPDPIPSPDGGCSRRPINRVICRTKAVPWSDNHRRTLELLLDRGASIEAMPGWQACSALSAAAACGNREAIEILLARHGALDIFDAAALADDARVAVLLKKNLALVNARSTGNATVLHYCANSALGRDDDAAAERLATIAELVLAKGAALELAEVSPLTPYSIIRLGCQVGNVAVLQVLLAHGADPQQVFYEAAIAQQMGVLDLLPTYLASIDLNMRLRDKVENTLLNDLIRYNGLQTARWLLQHGADPNQSDGQGFTALHYAARRGVSADFLALLLQHGARLDVKDEQDRTPLDVAILAQKNKAVDFLGKR